MKIEIKRTKQPDGIDILNYRDSNMRIFGIKGEEFIVLTMGNQDPVGMPLYTAKELAKVLPKFLEEMER